ncbi:hypothetical protein SMICM304S_07948 [Streptomyces microflavus]
MTAGRSADDYPWFDAVTTLAGGGGHLFTGRLSLDDGPWLADHVVGGQVYVPGAGLVDAALFAARTAGADAVADLTLLEPVVLLPGRALRIQATVGDPDAHGRRPFAFYSQPEDTDEPLTWQQRVTGECVTRARVGGALPPDIDNWPVPEARALDIEAFYGRALANGLRLRPGFPRTARTHLPRRRLLRAGIPPGRAGSGRPRPASRRCSTPRHSRSSSPV